MVKQKQNNDDRVQIVDRVRTSPRVADLLRQVAANEDRSIANLVRHFVHDGLRQRGLAVSEHEITP